MTIEDCSPANINKLSDPLVVSFSIWLECPSLPPIPGYLCVTPAGSQDCHYGDGSEGGTDLAPFVSKCCCGQCDTDTITCAPDSTTGSGLWYPMHSPLCPAQGCGTKGRQKKREHVFLS